MFQFTPDMLQKALTGLGIAAGQLKNFDDETKRALARFFMRAVGSGDANGYIKGSLAYLEARDETPAPPRPVRATARAVPVQGQFDEDDDEPRPPRPRKR